MLSVGCPGSFVFGQVVLNVNAASLQLVVNASPGKIVFVQVHRPGQTVCY